MKRLSAALAAAILLAAGCTPGGVAPNAPSRTAAFVIDVNLTLHARGYAPSPLTVPVGTTVQFVNSDGFAHTATMVAGTSFPAASPFTSSAQTQSGTTISSPWSSGTLVPGASSQPIAIDAQGTYLYACFFHYGAPMRGSIVAQ